MKFSTEWKKKKKITVESHLALKVLETFLLIEGRQDENFEWISNAITGGAARGK